MIVLLFVLVLEIPLCALILTVVMEKHTDRIVEAIEAHPQRAGALHPLMMRTIDAGRMPDLEAIAQAKAKAPRVDEPSPGARP